MAFQWHNLLFCFVGCVIGTLIGVLPGIYYGAQYGVLFPLILFIALIGAWVINGSVVPAPMVLACVLAPILENALRQSLILSAGSLSIFVTRPISAAFLILVAGLLISAVLPSARSARSISRSPLR